MNPRRGLVEKELKPDAKSAKAVPNKPVFGQEQAGPLVPKASSGAPAAGVPGKAGSPKISSTSGAASANVLNGTEVARRLRVDEEVVREWVRRGFLKGTVQAIQLYELEKFKTSYPGEITRAQQSSPPAAAAKQDSRGPKKGKSGVTRVPPDKAAPDDVPEKVKPKSKPAGMNPLILLAVAMAAVRDILGGLGKKKPKEAPKAASAKGAASGRLSRGVARDVDSESTSHGGKRADKGHASAEPDVALPDVEGPPLRGAAGGVNEVSPPPRPVPVSPREEAVVVVPEAEPIVQPIEIRKTPLLEPPEVISPPLSRESEQAVPLPPLLAAPEEPPGNPPAEPPANAINWLESSESLELDIDLDAFRSEPAVNPLRGDPNPFAPNESPDLDAFMVFDDDAQGASSSFTGLFSSPSSAVGDVGPKGSANLSGIALAGPSPGSSSFAPKSGEDSGEQALPPLPASKENRRGLPWESDLTPAPDPDLGAVGGMSNPPVSPATLKTSNPPTLSKSGPPRIRDAERKDSPASPEVGGGLRVKELEERAGALEQELLAERQLNRDLDGKVSLLEVARAALTEQLGALRTAQEQAQQSYDLAREKIQRLEHERAGAGETVDKAQFLVLQEELTASLRQNLALSQRYDQEKTALTARYEEQIVSQQEHCLRLERSQAQAQAQAQAAEVRRQTHEQQLQGTEQQRQALEQQAIQMRQMQAQREQQFQTLRAQMLQSQEQRDAQIVSLRAQLGRSQEPEGSSADVAQLKNQVLELQSKLQQAENGLQSTQREQSMQSQRWAKELQTAGSWVGKLTEAVAAKDKRIQELEAQVARQATARPAMSDSEAQAQLMAAKVEVGSLKRSGEVAQLQVSKLESQLQESRNQTLAVQRELAMLRERLEKQMLEEKSPREGSTPQAGKRLSLNLSEPRQPGSPLEPERRREDNLG